LSITTAVDETTTVKIYTLSGKTISTGKLTNDVTPINISNLKPGVYIVKVTTGKEVFTKKFVKE